MKAAPLRIVHGLRPVGMPERVYGESEALHEARIAAIHRLGRQWVGHPDYRFNPRHSNNPDIYVPARRAFLDAIARAAAADRSQRPAFLIAERIRAVLGSQS